MARSVHSTAYTLHHEPIYQHGNDLMRKFASVALLFFTFGFALLGTGPSRSFAATSNQAIYSAANDYRAAVVLFERVVKSVRGIQRTDERLVDKFEEETKRLSLAARNPRHSNRLRDEWKTIQTLQLQVESTIFNRYTYNHQLVRAWDDVLYAQSLFYEEYLFTLDNPRHGNSVQRRIIRSRPERFVPPPPASSGRIYSDASSQGR
jgi:hypothetical protein